VTDAHTDTHTTMAYTTIRIALRDKNHSVFNTARNDGVAVTSDGPYTNHLHLVLPYTSSVLTEK